VITTEEFIRRAELKHGLGTYIYKNSIYEGMRTKIEIVCKKHGSFWQWPNNHLKGLGCKKCSSDENGIRKSTAKEKDSVGKLFPNVLKEWDYDRNKTLNPFSLYPGSHKKSWWKCEKCGNNWKAQICDKLKGMNCPVCNLKLKNDLQSICNNFYESFAFKFPYLVDEWDYDKNDSDPKKTFPKSNKRMWWKCKICNKSYSSVVSDRAKGTGCPKCASSKGEKIINRLLINYYYRHQYRIESCRRKLPLPFDFAIFKNSDINSLVCLIEYNGEQHYIKNVKGYYTEENFKRIESSDKIKESFCKTNNIPLYIISYKDKDRIEEILTEIIKKHKLRRRRGYKKESL
jgi:hypothetical protein